jgi:predicted nucleotide-binding protein (sugar kinase/HSP70/actin superfamily)
MSDASGPSPRRIALTSVDDAAIQAAVAATRQRLLAEAGLSVGPIAHFHRPAERPFTRAEREQVTILFGGLTTRHEALVHAGLEGLGYTVAVVPTPRKADFQAGKEYGNNGQCNPTYFTVGALVNYLKDLRDRQGLSRQHILDHYVFLTAGACGPCRFGMYEAEYRLALENSGFGGFRVLLFQQGGGLNQAELEAGLAFNLNFFLTLLNALFMGDLLNEVAYQIRPYETQPGQTNAVLAKCLAICQQRLRSKSYDAIHGGAITSLLQRVTPLQSGEDVAKFLDQLTSGFYVDALAECARLLQDDVEVDYLRPKPIVKITGEFWAQTTEGDGNFQMFRFLEREGAEVLVEPVATWIAYMLNQARTRAHDRRGLADDAHDAHDPARRRTWRERWQQERQYRRTRLSFTLADKVLTREYERLRHALGGTAHALVNQLELQRMAHPYYHTRAGGGEGHLEVAKSIYYTHRHLAHMVLSLKPFGCMPSAQSDGAHAAVMAHFPDLLFLPIETSGEGDINAHSRVQMALGEAKSRAKTEFRAAVDASGYTLDEIRAYVAAHRELRRPLQHLPHGDGTIGRAATFCRHVASLMRRDAGWTQTRTSGACATP